MAFDKDLKVNIIGDASKLTNAMGKAGGQVDKFAEKIGKIGKTMTIVGGAVTAAFGAIIMKTTQLGDTYDKMAKRTNVSVEALSALGYAAKISGADLDTVEKSLRYLARGMDDMSMGVGEAKDAFEFLDIAVVNAEGNLRPTIEVLKEAATKLATMTDETKQVALATDIFGARYGTQLLPMLKEGGAGIEALMNKAKELGVVMSTEAAAKAAEFNDRITDLKESVGGIGRDIGTILIPPLIEFSEKAIEIIKRIKEWAEAHKPLVDMIVKVGATLGVLAAVGGPILLAVSAFMKMKVAITAIGVAIKVLAISSGPIGWLILAVGALALAWTTNFGGIKSKTIEIVDKVKETLKSLRDSLDKTKKSFTDFSKGLESGGGGLAGAFASELDNVTKKMDEANKVITLNAEVTGKMGAGVEAAKRSFKDLGKEVTNAYTKLQNEFLPAMQAVEDTIYRLTHTEYETTLRNINMHYEGLIEKAKTLGLTEEQLKDKLDKINEAWKLEIKALKELHPEKDKDKKDNDDLADSYKNLKKPIEEAAGATKQLGDVGISSFEGFTTQIKHATTALSNFTKEGVAAAIANIKMKFRPMINDLITDMNRATGIFKQIAEANLNRIRKTMNDQIDVIRYGLDVYNQAMGQMSGGGGGGSMMPTYSPPVNEGGGGSSGGDGGGYFGGSKSVRNTYSPSIVVNVSDGGNTADIKRAVQEALDESNRQYFRQGKEILLGA